MVLIQFQGNNQISIVLKVERQEIFLWHQRKESLRFVGFREMDDFVQFSQFRMQCGLGEEGGNVSLLFMVSLPLSNENIILRIASSLLL